jgi:hypothetical protein
MDAIDEAEAIALEALLDAPAIWEDALAVAEATVKQWRGQSRFRRSVGSKF